MKASETALETEGGRGPEHTLDASGLTCPLHVLMCRAELARMEIGEELCFVGTDRGCLLEIPLLARYCGCEMVEQRSNGGRHQFRIRRRYRGGGTRAVRPPLRHRARRKLGVALAWLVGDPPAAGAA
ncbi:MAG: sulfurtransferase TusA family protein [Gammaproteobacteria bacterium]